MQSFIWILAAIFFVFPAGTSASLRENQRKIKNTSQTIFVDQLGRGNFTKIQAAIDSVPSNNQDWILINIAEGVYREQVLIPKDKPFIQIQGAGWRKTYVAWNSSESIDKAAAFTSAADNVIAKTMTFMNSYDLPIKGFDKARSPAVAATILGDKSAFYDCGFLGLQDTLWDSQGRHYFKNCVIEGAVDFIFGAGQSIYESCTISVVGEALKGITGYITAQGRSQPEETNGFVFNNCNIVGNGKAYLGRAWRGYARVVFYKTSMSDIIVPQGWEAWNGAGHEDRLTFDEVGCQGPGSDTSKRVSWANKLNNTELQQFTSFSFIDGQSWIN